MASYQQLCAKFEPDVETVCEFLERFQVQCSDQITTAGENENKLSTILIKALPVNIITDLQRGLKPKKLSEATYNEIQCMLKQQFEVKKSVVAASVSFISRKQNSGETIEQYAQALNNLADDCEYKPCCRSRYLRDIFVAGLNSTKIITALLHHECDKMDFKDVVQKAKMFEAFSKDVEDIKCDSKFSNALSSNSNNSNVNRYEKVPNNYVCIRCGTKAKHFVKNCYAIKMTCSYCKKVGHISKCCKNKSATTHQLQAVTAPAATANEETCGAELRGSAGVDEEPFHVNPVHCTCNEHLTSHMVSSTQCDDTQFDDFLA